MQSTRPVHLAALTNTGTTGRHRIGHAADGSRQAGNLHTVDRDAAGFKLPATSLRTVSASAPAAQGRSPDVDTFPSVHGRFDNEGGNAVQTCNECLAAITSRSSAALPQGLSVDRISSSLNLNRRGRISYKAQGMRGSAGRGPHRKKED